VGFPGGNPRVDYWDMATGRRLLTLPHVELVIRIAISPNDDTLLSATASRTSPLRLWSLKSGMALREYPSPFDLDTKSERPPEVTLDWKLPLSEFLSESGFGYTAISFDVTGHRCVAGCEDGRIIVWETATARKLKTLKSEQGRILSVAISPNGSRLLSATRDYVVQLWDLTESALLRSYEENEPTWFGGHRPPVAFSSDSSKFAFYAPGSRAIRICHSQSGEEIARLPETSHIGPVLQIALGRELTFLDDSRLFSHNKSVLKIWDLESKRLLAEHKCKSNVSSGYAYPGIEYVRYLSDGNSFVVVEVANDSNTGLDDRTIVSFLPLSKLARDAP
jgi:WD40 repeat protein